jgi:hypothetical protein
LAISAQWPLREQKNDQDGSLASALGALPFDPIVPVNSKKGSTGKGRTSLSEYSARGVEVQLMIEMKAG